MNTQLHDGWNPGLEADIPARYRALETIFRPQNVATDYAEANELAQQTGLSHEELVVFRPMRLALHELMVRVSADIVVPEGEDEAGLGRDFRRIVGTILAHYIEPHQAEIEQTCAALREQVRGRVQQRLGDTLFRVSATVAATPRSLLARLLGRTEPAPAPRESRQEREFAAILEFKSSGRASVDPLDKSIHRSLYRVLGSIMTRRGYVGPDRELLADLVTRHVCNQFGSALIGRLIAPWVDTAIDTEAYCRTRTADKPILISLKGASAAGKSSLRPMLKQIMQEHGIAADGYATISPDIWRQMLLDYASLGEAYKYAGRLTSREVIIVDGKLDRYIRDKADRDLSIPNLLVDRFRFDSFSSEKISRVLHDTYAKYVDTMFMYFVVTPPEATVERGWERGLKVGRYKSVEDYLDHSLEAYVGMPKLLFKWLVYERPLYRFEFLDNSVAKGTFPNTIARGTRDAIDILDPIAMIDIERYQKINIKARTPAEVHADAARLSVSANSGFLRQCIERIATVNFVDAATGSVYARVERGNFAVVDGALLARRLQDPQLASLFEVVVGTELLRAAMAEPGPAQPA